MHFHLSWDVRYALLIVLSYSGLLWCWFYPRQDMPMLVDGSVCYNSVCWRMR